MSELKSIIIPFLIGGTVISGVKYASSHVQNTALAAIIGGVPTGLIAIYFVSDEKSLKYAHTYFFVTLSLLTAIAIFYVLHTYTNMKKDVVLLISLICWATFIGIRYMLAGNDTQ
jgi:peptidoglycan/LPS O-acetylase OafA/YrhL